MSEYFILLNIIFNREYYNPVNAYFIVQNVKTKWCYSWLYNVYPTLFEYSFFSLEKKDAMLTQAN